MRPTARHLLFRSPPQHSCCTALFSSATDGLRFVLSFITVASRLNRHETQKNESLKAPGAAAARRARPISMFYLSMFYLYTRVSLHERPREKTVKSSSAQLLSPLPLALPRLRLGSRSQSSRQRAEASELARRLPPFLLIFCFLTRVRCAPEPGARPVALAV